MRQLSPDGQQAVNDIARRHGFSPDAVASMLNSVINGNGGMAQFNHPEFAGSGQWMRGGMIMLSDMFNNNLKARVDSLAYELADLVASQPGLIATGSFQSQTQGYQGQGYQNQGYQGQPQGPGVQGTGFAGAVSLFVPPPPGQGANWWPDGIGMPDSTGAQNNVRYAWFSGAHRLAIDVNGTVTLYDTLDHWIGGFSQQQSLGGSLSFSSQYGLIDVASLPVISVNGQPPAPPPAAAPPAAAPPAAAPPAAAPPAAAPPVAAPPVAAPPVVAPPIAVPPVELPPVEPPPAVPVTVFAEPAPVPAPIPAPAPTAGGLDIFGAIEKLADLKARGILSEAEFAAKKAELLGRL
ncbi:SHOCT domain-containing protein [Zavarzinia compransoris]|uniref:SHOCT domain-containing protein n=1 Tax=Zavarzinia compransoris TaxID=1264899 RepID=A0A317EAA1_9PROT|nr:SHOCT domain-containing protein [Zavarzinia compransoris]PWR22233.1 hypothetical protein DKG75_09730 [Zavarzinia compransoris]TDP47010.1 putative oligomerization/nucleic acid binding protein [Zavarzinia compransoris]